MADLLTHAAAGYALSRWSDRRTQSIFLVGTVLPDVLYAMGSHTLGGSRWFSEPSHAPLMIPLFCYVGALLFQKDLRRRAFLALTLGAWVHLLLDVFMSHLGDGVILWAFPFSMSRFELGFYHPRETIYLLPAALTLALLSEAIFRRRKQVAGDGIRPRE